VQFSTLTGSTLINTVISTNTVIATYTVTGSIGIFHNSLGAAAPTVGISGGAGERLILWPGTSAAYPYSIGINGSTLWYSVPSGAQHNWYVGGVSAMFINSSGYVGIGTTNSSSSLLHLHSTSGSINRATGLNIYTPQAGIVLDSTQSSGGHSWNIWSEIGAGSNPGGLNIYDSTVPAYRLTINSSGNVGIGTVNASAVLQVNNTGAYRTNHLIISGQEFYQPGNSSTGIAFNMGVNRTGNKQLWIMDPDHAINTTNGALRISTVGTAGININCVSTDGTTDRPIAISGSSVGITTLGTGTVYSNGGVLTNTNPSDRTLKTNITPLSNMLEKVLQLDPVSYNWINTETHGAKLNYGFIAQDIQDAIPDICSEFQHEIKGDPVIDGTGFKIYPNITYETKIGYDPVLLIPFLVGSIKEQQSAIQALQTTVINLTKQLDSIKKN
jgi:hypothetical protein